MSAATAVAALGFIKMTVREIRKQRVALTHFLKDITDQLVTERHALNGSDEQSDFMLAVLELVVRTYHECLYQSLKQ